MNKWNLSKKDFYFFEQLNNENLKILLYIELLILIGFIFVMGASVYTGKKYYFQLSILIAYWIFSIIMYLFHTRKLVKKFGVDK